MPASVCSAGCARFRVLAYRLVTSKQSAAKRRGLIVDSSDKLKFNGIFGGAETLSGSFREGAPDGSRVRESACNKGAS